MSSGMIRKEQLRNAAKMYGGGSSSQSYDCAWTAATTNPTLADGTLTSRYVVRGNTCLVMIYLVFGASTNGGSGAWSFSLPFAAASNGIPYFGPSHLRDAGTNNYDRFAQVSAGATSIDFFIQLDSGTNVNTITASTPFTWGNGDSLSVQIEYELA